MKNQNPSNETKGEGAGKIGEQKQPLTELKGHSEQQSTVTATSTAGVRSPCGQRQSTSGSGSVCMKMIIIVQRSQCCLWTFASVWRLTSSIRSKHWHLSMNRWFIGVLFCMALKRRRHRWVSNRRRTTGNLEDVLQTCCSS